MSTLHNQQMSIDNSQNSHNMGGSGLFFLGGMLGRIFGPVVSDYIEFETSWGQRMSQKKFEKERTSKQADYNDKVKLTDIDHLHKLETLQIQFEQNRKKAEEQMILSLSEWQQKVFWEKCFPLRNPFEMPFGIDLKFQESKERLERNREIESCSIQTITLPNNKKIVPLRVITALKDSTSPNAPTVNGDLSMFLAQYYSANNDHAVLSDIGAWKEDAPINDASINYLFRGQRGLPTLIIAPTYTNGGTIIRMKLWSWGLGEDVAYPVGFDFGWFNIEVIYRQILLKEIKAFDNTLNKIQVSRPTPYKDFEQELTIIKLIEKADKLSDNEQEQLLSLLQKTPQELTSIVQRKTNEVISTIYSCATAMYADGYHLSNYGTFPILPYILPQLPGAKMLFPQIQQYYLILLKVSSSQGIISYEDAIGIEMDMYDSFKNIVSSLDDLKPLTKQIRGHLFDIKDLSLCDKTTINTIYNQIKLLLQ